MIDQENEEDNHVRAPPLMHARAAAGVQHVTPCTHMRMHAARPLLPKFHYVCRTIDKEQLCWRTTTRVRPLPSCMRVEQLVCST
jgi:hypothetical protein